jgi:hypothetical protein
MISTVSCIKPKHNFTGLVCRGTPPLVVGHEKAVLNSWFWAQTPQITANKVSEAPQISQVFALLAVHVECVLFLRKITRDHSQSIWTFHLKTHAALISNKSNPNPVKLTCKEIQRKQEQI